MLQPPYGYGLRVVERAEGSGHNLTEQGAGHTWLGVGAASGCRREGAKGERLLASCVRGAAVCESTRARPMRLGRLELLACGPMARQLCQQC